MSYYNKAKSLTKNKEFMASILIIGFLVAGGLATQSSWSTEGIWEIDVEITAPDDPMSEYGGESVARKFIFISVFNAYNSKV